MTVLCTPPQKKKDEEFLKSINCLNIRDIACAKLKPGQMC